LLTLANGCVTVEKISLAIHNTGRQGVGPEAANYQFDFFRSKITRANPAKNTIILIHQFFLSRRLRRQRPLRFGFGEMAEALTSR
jgi:hypothetical protein